MDGKLLRIISPDKIENRDAEYYKQALDLIRGIGDFMVPLFYRSVRKADELIRCL